MPRNRLIHFQLFFYDKWRPNHTHVIYPNPIYCCLWKIDSLRECVCRYLLPFHRFGNPDLAPPFLVLSTFLYFLFHTFFARFFIYHDRLSNESKWFSLLIILPIYPPFFLISWTCAYANSLNSNLSCTSIHPLTIFSLLLYPVDILFLVLLPLCIIPLCIPLWNYPKYNTNQLDLRFSKYSKRLAALRRDRSLWSTFLILLCFLWRERGIQSL